MMRMFAIIVCIFLGMGSAFSQIDQYDWYVESNLTSANMGQSVSTAGDVNGDGYSDVIVGLPDFDNNTGKGRIELYLGSASGLPSTPSWFYNGNQNFSYLGEQVATAGDVNGDGFSDIIVSAYSYDVGPVGGDHGAVYVFHGSALGLSSTPDWTMSLNLNDAHFGSSVSSAGDVNNDGFSDVIIGARNYYNGQSLEGAVFVYYGSATGLPAAFSWSYESNQAYAFLGNSVASAGDVNGDNYQDIIIGAAMYDNGATNNGIAMVFTGGAAGLNATPAWTYSGATANENFGVKVSSAGDVNGDGYSEIIVGAAGYSNGQPNEGAAFVFYGNAVGPSNTPDAVLELNLSWINFPSDVGMAGDMNGDGYADIIISASQYSTSFPQQGVVALYLGSDNGISTTYDHLLTNDVAFSHFGISANVAGDVNGDGLSDIIVGASNYSNVQTGEGAIYVFLGETSSLSQIPNWTNQGYTAAQLGSSVSNAGDVNGDGYMDVIVGAKNYNAVGSAFVYLGSASGMPPTPNVVLSDGNPGDTYGVAVSTAGDVNGDGYADVLVGAPKFDNGESNEGIVWLYYGSPTGINPTPVWSFESNVSYAEVGTSVSDAGDVNGDGFGDFMIGAPDFENTEPSEGAVYLFFGSPMGPSNSPDWFYEANLPSSFLGRDIDNAGDVNGDGYSDIIVGASIYDYLTLAEGATFVFHGSISGPSATPDWVVGGDETAALFGASVSSAGDVNGDGYSDVLVGIPEYSGTAYKAGRVHLYLGGASGLSIYPNWIGENSVANSNYGYDVNTAGDVNGDGLSDIIIGACFLTNGQVGEGAAYIYYGNATGVSIAPDWYRESNEGGSRFGNAVAGVGDINGDGFSDFLIGSMGFNLNEGKISSFYGNSMTSDTKDTYIKLYRSDLTTPLWENTTGDYSDYFGVGQYTSSHVGRTSGDLHCEVVNEGMPFSGNPIANSTIYSSSIGSFTDLGLNGTELKIQLLKTGFRNKARVRTMYQPSKMIDGQPLGKWFYLGEVGMNGIGILPMELIKFEAFPLVDEVLIKWETASEQNNDYFEVQHSQDGVNWKRIIDVKGAGNSTHLIKYQTIDSIPVLGTSYYRLKQVDFNGNFSFSELRTVRYEGSSVHIYPNPVHDILNIKSEKRINNIQLIDQYGKLKKVYQNLSTIDLQFLSPGIYVLHLCFVDGTKQSLKIIKI